VIHRIGRVAVGEDIVLVVTSSAHRAAAFKAAEFLMDYLKAQAPFWKRADSATGTTWVDAHSRDDAASERWGVRSGVNTSIVSGVQQRSDWVAVQ
jgi:molybdopterin synthase catalytic subunit